ncbi:MAG: HEAT repeat domain-containing protein [Chloroflexi bacterium]|nr:HEAT repeat domain-containing protein [Chloroflexota bacterium]
MLTIIALVHRIEAELPNERVKLYDKCTEALLTTWESVRGLIPTDRERPYYKNRRRWVEKLAFWMHSLPQETEQQVEVKRGDLKAKMIEFLLDDATLNLSRDTAEVEADAFIEMAKSRTGVLIERGDGVYSFIHLTFQEYFAACDLEKRYSHDLDLLWKNIQPHLFDPRWLEVVLLLLGRLNERDEPPSVIMKKFLRERDKFDEVLKRHLFLAARCLADRVNVRESLQNEIIDGLVKLAHLRYPRYYTLRDTAIETLGTLNGNMRAGEALLALAQDAKIYAGERLIAAEALGQLGRSDDAVRILLALAQDARIYEGLRIAAAEALGRLGRRGDAVRILLALAQDAKIFAEKRIAAAQALGQLGRSGDAVRILLALAQDAKIHRGERIAAVQALGQLGAKNPRVALALYELTKSRIGSVRDTAFHALKEGVGNLKYAEISRQPSVASKQKTRKRKAKKARRQKAAGSHQNPRKPRTLKQ